jgi:GTP-binding protein
MNDLVTIVGRPNVGKSTLFNRLTETRDAITDPTAGTTRDRKYGKVLWGGRQFTVIDTGGYAIGSEDRFEAAIRRQVTVSIEEAALVLFMVDAVTGLTDLDQEIAQMLRKSDKPTIVVANKVDTSVMEYATAEFYALGLTDIIYPSSASNGYGTGELLDALVVSLPDIEEREDDGVPRLAVVGRPNVGKSTLVNTLLGEDRNIVTDIAGTTRDSVHSHYKGFGLDIEIVDTAGLRKRRKVDDDLEFYSTVRTVKAIERSDVCLLLIDAENGVEKQDQTIFWHILDSYRGVVVVVNKWDLIEKDTHTMERFKRKIIDKFEPFTDVSVVFTSNLTKQRVIKALEEAMTVYENRRGKVSTSDINAFILPIIENNPPPIYKGKSVRIKYVTQIPSQVPTFAFYCNLPQYVKEQYKRFLENKMREEYNFTGVPIRLFFRKK